jgi:hypothetical protein
MKAGDHQAVASDTEHAHAVAEHRLEETTA